MCSPPLHHILFSTLLSAFVFILVINSLKFSFQSKINFESDNFPSAEEYENSLNRNERDLIEFKIHELITSKISLPCTFFEVPIDLESSIWKDYVESAKKSSFYLTRKEENKLI
jgi:hypothetical protein